MPRRLYRVFAAQNVDLIDQIRPALSPRLIQLLFLKGQPVVRDSRLFVLELPGYETACEIQQEILLVFERLDLRKINIEVREFVSEPIKCTPTVLEQRQRVRDPEFVLVERGRPQWHLDWRAARTGKRNAGYVLQADEFTEVGFMQEQIDKHGIYFHAGHFRHTEYPGA